MLPPDLQRALALVWDSPNCLSTDPLPWQAGDVAVISVEAGDSDQAEALQAEALAAGASAVHLSPGLDDLRLGPIISPGGRGCIMCLRMWEKPRRRRAAGARPWAPAFVQAAALALHEAVRTGPTATVRHLHASFRGWTSHHLWPHPDCPACANKPADSGEEAGRLLAPAGALLSRGLRSRDLIGELPRIRDTLCDARYGFVSGVTHRTPSHLQPMAFAPFRIDGQPEAAEVGVGRTGSRRADALVALVEALERFSGFRPRGRRTAARGAYATLHATAIDPRLFILHGPEQVDEPGYRLTPYSDELPVAWVWAYSFRRGGPVLIPEQLAYYNLPSTPEEPSNRFVFEISNGCSVGATIEEAVLHGLFETVERDAFLTSWYADKPCPQLDLSGVDDAHVRALIACLEGAGLEVRCFDVGVGLSLPTVAVALLDSDPDTPAAVTLAAGANPDPVRAAAGALIEACTMLQRKQPAEAAALRERGRALLAEPSLVQTAADHIGQCRPHEAVIERCFRSAPGAPVPIASRFPDWARRTPPFDAGAEVARLADELLNTAEDILVVDQSFPGLRELGLRCVKVLVPGLHPMTFGHQYRRISGTRLATAAGGAPARPFLPHIFP